MTANAAANAAFALPPSAAGRLAARLGLARGRGEGRHDAAEGEGVDGSDEQVPRGVRRPVSAGAGRAPGAPPLAGDSDAREASPRGASITPRAKALGELW